MKIEKRLTLLTAGHALKATDGVYNREDFEDKFPAKVCEDIEDYGCGENDSPTEESFFDRHSVVADSTFMQLFTELSNSDASDLFFTKSQIKAIFEENPEFFTYSFEERGGRFFFYENKERQRFVISLHYNNGWGCIIYKLKWPVVWKAERNYVVFVPSKLKA
jgi:hypothetical protein